MTKRNIKIVVSNVQSFFYEAIASEDKMNTPTGKQIALERHRFMETFIAQFYAEWDGEKWVFLIANFKSKSGNQQ
jgi:uncharacterized protein